MYFVTSLFALLFSSIILNVYLLSERETNETFKAEKIPNTSSNNNETNQNIFINCTEEAVSFIINEWFLQNDFRFELQQTEFSPKIFFPIIEYNNVSKKELFDVNNIYTRHIAFNYPFVLRGALKKWKAYRNWKNETYLLEKIGNHTIKVEKKPQGNFEFAYFRKDYKRIKMKYHKFIDLCQNYLNEKFIYYWAEQKIPTILRKDIKEPKFAKLMNLEEVHIWHGSAGTISLPHTDARDNFLCQVVGSKELILVPPTQRNLLYIEDDFEKSKNKRGKRPKNYSPVNFFKPDYKKFPNFANVRGKMYVKIEEGDLLYIPSFWWHHVKSSANTNIAVNFWYTPNFMMMNLYAGINENFIGAQ